MKGTVRINTIIAGIICILSLTCCKHEANYRSDLLRADSVMDARPDSAYGIVAKVRPDSLDEANRALLCLLSTQAKWKTFQDVKQDTAWDEAIRHFTGQKDYDRLAKCYYYRGVVWKERNEVDKAMKDYLSAAEYIGKTRDYYYNNLINSYIGHLYMDQLAYDKTPKYLNAAYRAAETINDSLGMAYALMDMCDYYSCCKQSKRSIINAQKAFKLIRCDTTNKFYLVIANNLANAYYYLKDYQKSLRYALQILPMYSKDSSSDNGPRYATLARTYFALKKYDEAKKYYLQAIKSPIMETKVISYDGLHNIFEEKSERKLAAYYQTIADSLTQVIYDQNKSNVLVQAQGEHKLQKVEANNQQEQRKKTFIVWGIVGVSILGFGALCILSYKIIRAERAKRQTAVEKQNKIINRLNSKLKNETKVSRKLVNEAEYIKATRFLETMKLNPKPFTCWTEEDWRQIYVLVDCIDKGNIRTFLNNTKDLSEKETQVFMLSILGITTKQLGKIFSLAPVTISNIKLKVKKKIQSPDMAEVLGKYAEQMDTARGRHKR
jgi:tetratricopeptide (TPR) repeat protein/DNA-binding CsgD family transcriptional regulator